MIVYFDMDGVLADLEASVFSIFDKPISAWDQNEHKEFWNNLVEKQQTFRRLKPIPEGCDLMTMLHNMGADIRILTSTGGGRYHYSIAKQKVAWLEEWVPVKASFTAVRLSKEKRQYATDGAWLVDDYVTNCDDWMAAGGNAVQFRRDNIDAMMRDMRSYADRAARRGK